MISIKGKIQASAESNRTDSRLAGYADLFEDVILEDDAQQEYAILALSSNGGVKLLRKLIDEGLHHGTIIKLMVKKKVTFDSIYVEDKHILFAAPDSKFAISLIERNPETTDEDGHPIVEVILVKNLI